MSVVRFNPIVGAMVVLGCAVQVLFPAGRLSSFNMTLQPRVALAHNEIDKLSVELTNTTLHSQIAESVGLTPADLKAVQIRPERIVEASVWVSQVLPQGSNAFYRFADQFQKYADARLDGHTRECLTAGLTNQTPLSLIQDVHLRVLVADNFVLPASWFVRVESGTWTNSTSAFDVTKIKDERVKKAFASGQLRVVSGGPGGSWVKYNIVDGELAWSYVVELRSDGALSDIIAEKFDAKEIMPEFKELLQEVDREAGEEIKKIKSSGRRGDPRTFLEIKKERLKARGITWRPREELNGRIP